MVTNSNDMVLGTSCSFTIKNTKIKTPTEARYV